MIRERYATFIRTRASLRRRICHRQWACLLNNNLTVSVACSTVTVTKCQAALHTLQAFPFFRPTCLCREPHVDPDCNSFQNFLFDHPCIYVSKKGKFSSKENLHFSIDSIQRNCNKLSAYFNRPDTIANLSTNIKSSSFSIIRK